MKQEMQWHQLDHMQIICTSLQTDNNASTSSLSFYRLDALPDAQATASKHWRQSMLIFGARIIWAKLPAADCVQVLSCQYRQEPADHQMTGLLHPRPSEMWRRLLPEFRPWNVRPWCPAKGHRPGPANRRPLSASAQSAEPVGHTRRSSCTKPTLQHTEVHRHPFNGVFSKTTKLSQHQKG